MADARPSADPQAASPGGRKLLRLEVRNAAVPIERKPDWIKTRLRTGPEFQNLQELVKREGLHTVCQEAGCPNIYECWEDREATFLIGGDQCTRRCDFCLIDTGKPAELDRDEPRRVAESIRSMDLRYATITGVTRDDLPDEGAWLYAETVRQVHALSPGTGVEILTPDFSGKRELLGQVFDAAPEVFAHNLETVPRIFRRIRPAFSYDKSLDGLAQGRAAGMVTKSNLILGMGETRAEISLALRDMQAAGCDLVTITQYLRPTPRHHPVDRWVKPDEFVELREEAEEVGFAGVMSGPLVRSSYRAGTLYRQGAAARRRRAGLARPADDRDSVAAAV
jgi:lipoyl synthase